MCLYPKLVRNPKYTENTKNGGIIPPVYDTRVLYVPIGCGNCIECRKKYAREWQIRLQEDIKHNTNGKFVGMTFSNESIKLLTNEIKGLQGYDLDNQIATLATRRFLERHRKKYKVSLRHFLITELGHNGTENIHLHGIIWTDTPLQIIEEIWQYGHMWKGQKTQTGKIINYVNGRTINYTTKYITKKDEVHKTYKSIILTSKGIGKQYTQGHDYKKNKYNGTNTIETYKTPTGHKISMPIYWRNKIYTEEEREKLWLQRLDKEERWICGTKIDISQDYTEYDKLLKYHRHRNKELGYGDYKKHIDQIEYEKTRRTIMQETRIKNSKK